MPTARDSNAIAIIGVTVIDVVAGVRVPEQTVVVRGTRIVAVGPSARLRSPASARLIDGRRKYLVPGLWDMHVHTLRNRMDAPGENTDDSEVFFPAFVANGVTGVRDMSTDLADHAQIRRWTIARAARTLIGPRMIGQMEHLRDSTISHDSVYQLRRAFRQVVAERLDCAPLAAHFGRNRTWQVPTFAVKRPRAFAHDSATRGDSRLRFISRRLMAEWKATGLPGLDRMSAADVELQRMTFRIEQRIVGLLHLAGVPIFAGSDVHNPYVYPGFSLHDELALLVESGLSPLEAMRAATINPVRFLGATDSLGAVAAGKIADLVMLDADPLLDIANSRRIHAVVLDGSFLGRAALDALRAAAERAAGSQRTR